MRLRVCDTGHPRWQVIELSLQQLEDRGTPLDAAIFAGWSHGPIDYARLQMDANAIFAEMVATNGY